MNGKRPDIADAHSINEVSANVDKDAGTIVWPNRADLDPLVLHSKVTGIPIALDLAKRKTR